MVDYYRNRLKRAQWTWLETWHPNPHHKKDVSSGRCDKRSARNEEKREIEIDVVNGHPLHWDDYDDSDCFYLDSDVPDPFWYANGPLRVSLLESVSFT